MRTHIRKRFMMLCTFALVLDLQAVSGSVAVAGSVFYNPATGHYYTLTDGQYFGIASGSGCPDSLGSYEGDCELPTWIEAEGEARALGGDLVTINDAAENQWLVDTFGATEEFWIGLTDHDLYSTEGVWVWISGEPVTYLNPAPAFDDAHEGEDVAHLNHICGGCPGAGFWNDLGNDPAFYPHHAEYSDGLRGIIESERPIASGLATWGAIKHLYR